MDDKCHSCGLPERMCIVYGGLSWKCIYCGKIWKNKELEELTKPKLEELIISRFEILDIR